MAWKRTERGYEWPEKNAVLSKQGKDWVLQVGESSHNLGRKAGFSEAEGIISQRDEDAKGSGIRIGPRGGRYTEGPDGSKQYVKGLPMYPKNVGNKPLNWQEKKLDERTQKSESHEARLERHSRAGTPPTRRGAINGVMPALRPNPHAPELSPRLHLDVSKALGAPNIPLRPQQPQQPPAMPGMGPQVPGMQAQTPGMAQPGMPPKGPPGGGGPAGGSAGKPPPPAQGGAPKPPMGGQAPGQGAPPPAAPGMPPGAQGMAPGMPQQQAGPGQLAQPKIPGVNQMTNPQQAMPAQSNMRPIGFTADGQPIFADPFHPAHQAFQAPEHAMAAQQQQMMGNPQAANVHAEMGKDTASPMERGAQLVAQQAGPGMPPSGSPAGGRTQMDGGFPPQPGGDKGQPPMKAPEMKGSQQPYGVGPDGSNPDQGKPQAPPQPGPDRDGPKPGMSEKPPEDEAEAKMEGDPMMDQLMAWLKENQPQQSAGASSMQESKGAPGGDGPPKQTGPESPPTHAGTHKTPVEESAKKSLFNKLGW